MIFKLHIYINKQDDTQVLFLENINENNDYEYCCIVCERNMIYVSPILFRDLHTSAYHRQHHSIFWFFEKVKVYFASKNVKRYTLM